jgi:hypothetical protein
MDTAVTPFLTRVVPNPDAPVGALSSVMQRPSRWQALGLRRAASGAR